MNLIIALRTRANENLFRDAILASIRSGAGDTAYLCSGFFQEERISDYRASEEGGLGDLLAKNNVQLVTVGVYGGWIDSYRRFIGNLIAAGVNVDPYRLLGSKWHAKIFILRRKEQNIFGIVGSSNITRPAFSLDPPFNHECDVYLWNKGKTALNKNIQDLVKEYQSDDLIKSDYKPEDNSSMSVHQKLEHLKKSIVNDEKLEGLELD